MLRPPQDQNADFRALFYHLVLDVT